MDTLAGMLQSRLAAILLDWLSRRLRYIVRGIRSVRRRVWAKRRMLLSSRCRGRRRYVYFYVGDRMPFDIVRVEAVAACRKEY